MTSHQHPGPDPIGPAGHIGGADPLPRGVRETERTCRTRRCGYVGPGVRVGGRAARGWLLAALSMAAAVLHLGGAGAAEDPERDPSPAANAYRCPKCRKRLKA